MFKKITRITKLVSIGFVLTLCESIFNNSFAVNPPYISVGTGSVNGIYYPAGGAICKAINDNPKIGLKCFTESTSGSVYNLSAERANKIDMGFSQNDWLYHSYKGTDIFEKVGADENLRTLATFHTESLLLIVRKNSNINKIEDLKDKIISVGLKDSGTRWTIQRVFNAIGFKKEDLLNAKELKPSDEMKSICDGTIDAMFVVYGNPNLITKEMIEACGATIVSLSDDNIEKISKENAFYVPSTIAASVYHTQNNIKTVGLKSSIFVNKNLDEDIVFEIAKTIVKNLPIIVESNDVLKGVNKNTITKNNVVPFHSGALKYYQKAKLIKDGDGA